MLTFPVSQQEKIPEWMEEAEKPLTPLIIGLVAALGGLFWLLSRQASAKSNENTTDQRVGVPRTDYERLVNHFGKVEADRLLVEFGEGAYKYLPPRGTRLDIS